MAIELPSGLSGLFKLLTGMPWPQGNEDQLRAAGRLYSATSADFDQLADLVSQLVSAISEQFEGETATAFVASMKDLVSGDDYLGTAKQGAAELAQFADDTANQIEYMKWMILATLIELAAELAFYAATAWFNPFAEAEAVAAELAARVIINQVMRTVLRYLVQHVVLGLLTAVVMDRLIQYIQMRQGHRSSFDNSLLVQSIEFAGISSVLGMALGPLGSKLGSMLGKVLGKDFGKDLGNDLAKLFPKGFGPLTSAGTKDFATDLGRSVGDHGDDLANGFTREAGGDAKELAGGLGKDGDRDLKDMGDLLQPARADPIGALFVFLDLLKCQPERVAKLFLAHSQHHAAHTNATSDMLVGRVRRLFCEHSHEFLRPYLSQPR